MRAITRGWVVQVTPVHERNTPSASQLCFKFYTVTCWGGIADKQLGPSHACLWGSFPACKAPGESRHQVGSSCLWRIAGQARCLVQGGMAGQCLQGQKSCGTCSLNQCSQKLLWGGISGLGFWSELTFLLVLEELFQAHLLQFLPSTTQAALCWSLTARPVL